MHGHAGNTCLEHLVPVALVALAYDQRLPRLGQLLLPILLVDVVDVGQGIQIYLRNDRRPVRRPFVELLVG